MIFLLQVCQVRCFLQYSSLLTVWLTLIGEWIDWMGVRVLSLVLYLISIFHKQLLQSRCWILVKIALWIKCLATKLIKIIAVLICEVGMRGEMRKEVLLSIYWHFLCCQPNIWKQYSYISSLTVSHYNVLLVHRYAWSHFLNLASKTHRLKNDYQVLERGSALSNLDWAEKDWGKNINEQINEEKILLITENRVVYYN